MDEEIREIDDFDGAESFADDVRCPVCGSATHSVIYTQDGELIGCDMCIDVSIPCQHCGCESYKNLIYRDGELIGCDRCVCEVSKWECKSND